MLARHYTLYRAWFEFAAKLLLRNVTIAVLDPDRAKPVSIDFVHNSYHGNYNEDEK